MKIRVGVLCGAMLMASCLPGQAQPKPVTAAPITDEQMAATQEQLLKLLRVSPVLTSVVERDPTLLTDQAYVSRTNPQLADFLVVHPEVARNPDYFLFNGIDSGRGPRRYQLLEHKIWPEQVHVQEDPMIEVVTRTIVPFLIFIVVTAALLWLVKALVENRRWSRSIKLQVEAHSKLIERFSSNQELMAYMETDAGRKFLEAGPIPVDFGQAPRVPNAVARVLTPLQIGLVMTLLGAGFLLMRNTAREAHLAFTITGIVIMMPGLGFIISAALTWLLAGRLGLIPEAPATITRDRM